MVTQSLIPFAILVSLCAVAYGDDPLLRIAANSTSSKYSANPSSFSKPHFVRAVNRLGLQLLADLDANGNKNVFISPVSISSLLRLVQLGVTSMSASANELQTLIGSSFFDLATSCDPSIELFSANSVWTSTSVLNSYKSRVNRELGAKACPLPTNATPINAWVSNATRGNIPILFQKLPFGNIAAILINAIFFKAPWKIAFDPNRTVTADFFGPSGEFVSPAVSQVKMMRLLDENLKYAEVPLQGISHTSLAGIFQKRVKIVELDYGSSGELAATFVVPVGTTTLEEAIKPFQNGNLQVWSNWTNALAKTKVDVMALPRFRIEFGVESLKESLKRLGLNAPFVSTRANPQLLRLTADTTAFVGDVFHKATVDVNEAGTEASAVSAATVILRAAQVFIVLNRPFLFAIRNVKSGALIFIGKIDSP